MNIIYHNFCSSLYIRFLFLIFNSQQYSTNINAINLDILIVIHSSHSINQ
jgi:hypothetical protein